MAFIDDIITFQNRLSSNAPYLSFGSQSFIQNLTLAFLSANADTQTLIANNAINMYASTAQGSALIAKANDLNIYPSPGVAATTSVVFSIAAALTVPISLAAGTYVATVGDNITVISQVYATTTAATIPAGSLTSGSVPVQAVIAGSAGNVPSGAIVVMISPVGVASVSVTNPVAATGGIDPDTSAIVRQKILAALSPATSASNMQNAVLSVAGVVGASVVDPQDGSGIIHVYWGDINASVTNSVTQAAVQLAVNNTLPLGLKAVTPAAFPTINNVTAIAVTASIASNLSQTAMLPILQAGIQAYFQGLIPGAVPNNFSLASYMYRYTGNTLLNFLVTSSTPVLGGTPSPSVWWRMTGVASSIITVTWV